VPRRINVISRHLGPWTLRQTPGRTGIWGDCVFEINGRDAAYDGIVVYDDFREPLRFTCPPDAVLFLTGEPPAIKTYHPAFLAQFHAVATPHSDIAHPRVIDSHCGLPWHVGLTAGPAPSVMLDYDQLTAAAPQKTKLLSIVASQRNVTAAHRQRPALVDALKRRFGSEVDVFGREYKAIPDKWGAVAPYRYHVALENSRIANYWTEKLSDTFLGDAFPLYWGCPNLDAYFPSGAWAPINIFDIDAAVRAIERAIEADLYQNSVPARAQARLSVLTRYNFFAVITDLMKAPSASPARPVVLQPESVFRDKWDRKLRKRLQRAVPRVLRPKRWKI
jgi:hypothetical protein